MIRKITTRLISLMPIKIIGFFRKVHFLYYLSIYYVTGKPPYPNYILIDPGNICNLRCPLCPTGVNALNYERKLMSFDTFQIIFDKIPKVKYLSLFNWGEPLLNPDIFKMIKYASEQKVYVSIHSNFSIEMDNNFLATIVLSGMDKLIISLDGASQESYSKYRRGGDFELVISNIKRLIKEKEQLKSEKPTIVWKCMVNKYNEHELAPARKMANSLGVRFMTSKMSLGDDLIDFSFEGTLEERKKEWLPDGSDNVYEHYIGEQCYPLYPGVCHQLFDTIIINPDGKITPCCYVTDKDNVFGDLMKKSLEDIWCNDKYAYSRSLFTRKQYTGPEIKTVCSSCRNFTRGSQTGGLVQILHLLFTRMEN